jgi:hypothetical protein
MPILGIVASSKGAAASLAYDSIATVTLSSASSSITFSSIPSTYKHLQLRMMTFVTSAGNRNIQVGAGSVDTGTNYGIQELYGSGASVTAGLITGAPSSQLFYAPGDGATPAASVTDILDYTNTNKVTTFRTLGGNDLNGSGRITFTGGFWNNTAAWDTIKILNGTSSNYEAGSKFALYGIKG